MLNPLAIAQLGIGRRPIVAAMLGLWPDEYVPPLPVYVATEGSGVPPVREPARRRTRLSRGRPIGFGASLATVVPTIEAVCAVAPLGHSMARLPVIREVVRVIDGDGETDADVPLRLVSVPVFSGDEMLAAAAWAWRARH